MKNGRFVVAAGVACVCAAATAVELDSTWKIVAPEHEARVVTRAFARAAEVLRKDLAEGAGLKLQVVKTAPQSGHAIYLGADAAKAAGLKTDDLAWYDNAIAEKGGNLYLYGNDRARSRNADADEWFKAALPTVGAATRFLHDYLGDRFCMPGETGRHVGKRDRIAVPDGTRSVAHPSQIYASEYRPDMIYSYGSNLRGPGLFHSYGGHSYPRAVPREKYCKTHPEYFAMSAQGIRTGDMASTLTALCISNPEVEDLILGELIARFDEGADACQLAQNDGDARCHCPKCKALFGTGDDWNEKFWLFHRKIAERAQKLRPGKVVNILAYAQSQEPPKTFTKFPSNVMVQLCSYSEEMFDKWSKVDVPQGYTVYTYSWGNYQMPGFVGRHSFAFYADEARRFRRRNVKGVYRCGQIDMFGLEGPCYHVFNTLLDDPERPVDQVVAEYCQSMFGPAAALMQRFYDTQDARLRGIDLIRGGFPSSCGNGLARYRRATPNHNGDLHAWAYPPDTVRALEDYLSRAERTPGLTDREKRRLDLVRREFDYAKTMGEIGCLYSAYKWHPTQTTFDALAEALERRQTAMRGLSDEKGNAVKLPGWPELQVLGGSGYWGGTYWLKYNGRLSAKMAAPLVWDMKVMKSRGVLPGVTMSETTVAPAAKEPTVDEFVRGTGVWAKGRESVLKGLQGEDNVPEKTTFRLAYDGTAFYVGVKTDLAAGTAVPPYGPDGDLWQNDCLDLTIAPAKSTELNFHLIWSAAEGSRYDSARGHITDPVHPLYGQDDVSWNGTWSHTDRRIGDFWYSVLKIPYADLGLASAPSKGETWRFNVGRIAAPQKAGRGSDGSLSLWSPNLDKRDMSTPEAMGKIVFE